MTPQSTVISCYVAHRDLHSFPTRRSSDLRRTRNTLQRAGIVGGAVARPHVCYLRLTRARAAPCERSCKPWLLGALARSGRSEEHTSELQSHVNLVCRLLLEKKKTIEFNL